MQNLQCVCRLAQTMETSRKEVCSIGLHWLATVNDALPSDQKQFKFPLTLGEARLSQMQSCTYISRFILSIFQVVQSSANSLPLDRLITQDQAASLLDVGVWLLTILPPGFESWALTSLTCITDVSILNPVLRSGLQVTKDILSSNPNIKRDVEMYCKGDESSSELDARGLGEYLLSSYAASWLTLVPAESVRIEASSAQPHPAGFGTLELPASDSPAGSRLPLPHNWVALEAFCVPGPHTTLTVSHNPVLGALLLLLALENSNSRTLNGVSPAKRLCNLVKLIFLTKPDDLCPGILGESEVWKDYWVRRWTATLTILYIRLMNEAGVSMSSYIGKVFVGQVIDEFAYSSYGDPLFGRHVALFFHHNVTDEVIRWVWEGLHERDALDLLPQLDSWFGGCTNYANAPASSSTIVFLREIISSQSRCSTGWMQDFLARIE